jgi:hypothetical protein
MNRLEERWPSLSAVSVFFQPAEVQLCIAAGSRRFFSNIAWILGPPGMQVGRRPQWIQNIQAGMVRPPLAFCIPKAGWSVSPTQVGKVGIFSILLGFPGCIPSQFCQTPEGDFRFAQCLPMFTKHLHFGDFRSSPGIQPKSQVDVSYCFIR